MEKINMSENIMNEAQPIATITYQPFADIGTDRMRTVPVYDVEQLARGIASLYQNTRRGMPREYDGVTLDPVTGIPDIHIITKDTRTVKTAKSIDAFSD